jgi:hypothetical protein
MMNQETLHKLTGMKMGAMAEVYRQQSLNKEHIIEEQWVTGTIQ